MITRCQYCGPRFFAHERTRLSSPGARGLSANPWSQILSRQIPEKKITRITPKVATAWNSSGARYMKAQPRDLDDHANHVPIDQPRQQVSCGQKTDHGLGSTASANSHYRRLSM